MNLELSINFSPSRFRIGEATLRDFKLLFDRPGQYRYHFKTLDREFGMVKEEVSLYPIKVHNFY